MPQQISKKIFIYLLLLLFLGTLNNKNFNYSKFLKINDINVLGLDNLENKKILEKLKFLKDRNIFFIDKREIFKLMDSNNIIEKYYIHKKYPSTIKMYIVKTNFLAITNKNGKNYYFGSNGKFIEVINNDKELPFIYGKFKNLDFFELKRILDSSNFRFKNIENLFYFPSGRWDIETKSGILIKLPKEKIKEAIELIINIQNDDKFKNIKTIDLRQNNLIVVNE